VNALSGKSGEVVAPVPHQGEPNILRARNAHHFRPRCSAIPPKESVRRTGFSWAPMKTTHTQNEQTAVLARSRDTSLSICLSGEIPSPIPTVFVRFEDSNGDCWHEILFSSGSLPWATNAGTRDAPVFVHRNHREDIKPWRQFSPSRLYAQNHHERSPICTKGCHRIRAQARESAKTFPRRW